MKPEIFTVNDRDFLPPSVAVTSWLNPKSRKLFWHRHEIENYLVEPTVVHAWFEDLRQNPPPRMAVQNLPNTLAQVEALITCIAQGLIEHHVGQIAFVEMQRSYQGYTNKTSLSRPQSSGRVTLNPKRNPPPSRTDWLSALNVEWKRVESDRRRTGRIPSWTAHRIRELFDSLAERIRDPGYFRANTYLLDFEGKGVLWGLHDHLRHAGNSISMENLESELIRVLPVAYAKSPFKPDEFLDLAARMIQASK